MTHTDNVTPDMRTLPASLLAAADAWLNKKQTATVRGVSVATLDRMIARGDFPRGEPVSPGRVGWRLSTIKAAPLARSARRGGNLQRRADGEGRG
jgi:predicted DNA-binding transcriptional regulator AlpA